MGYISLFSGDTALWPLMQELGWTGSEEIWATNDRGYPAIEFALRQPNGGLVAFATMLMGGAEVNGPTVDEPLAHQLMTNQNDHPELRDMMIRMLDLGLDTTLRGHFEDTLLMRSFYAGVDFFDEFKNLPGIHPDDVDVDGRNALLCLADCQDKALVLSLIPRLLEWGVDPMQPGVTGHRPRTELGLRFPEAALLFDRFEAEVTEARLQAIVPGPVAPHPVSAPSRLRI